MNFQSKIESLGSDVWATGFIVPSEVAEKFIEGKDRRVICQIKNLPPFHCALIPTGDNSWMILLNSERRKKSGINEGDLIEVKLNKDRSQYGMEMPQELQAVLDQDREGSDLFHALSPGKIRNIIYYVSQVKSSEIRIRRALVIVDHLKRNGGNPDFRSLAEEIKDSNQRARR